ncbi:biotin/lipoyl-binding protein, partial [Faecalibacillus intestinalis]
KNVKLKNGEKVSKGDVLFEIDSDSLEKEKERIDDQIDKINEDISNLNKLNKSIDNNTNYFSNSGSEKEYYYKFKSYE